MDCIKDIFLSFCVASIILFSIIGFSSLYHDIKEYNQQKENLKRAEDLDDNPNYTFYLDGEEIDASKYILNNYKIKIDDKNSTILLYEKNH